MENLPHDGYLVDISALPIPGADTGNEYANQAFAAERELENYLLSLPIEVITDLMTLMYIGRECDANMTLSPEDRFIDYWSYLADVGCFSDGAYHMVTHMLEKSPLPDYLRRGLEIMDQPAQDIPPVNDEGEAYTGEDD